MPLIKYILYTILLCVTPFVSAMCEDPDMLLNKPLYDWLDRKTDLVLQDLKVKKFVNNNYDSDMFYNFCKEDIKEKYDPDDILGGCDKTFKSGIKVQSIQVAKLIELYLTFKHVYHGTVMNIPSETKPEEVYKFTDNIVCNDEWYTNWNDDYVQCFYRNTDSEKYYFYDFQFDSITEDDKDKIIKSTRNAICLIFGGCDNKDGAQCLKIDRLVNPIIGYNVKWNGFKGCTVESKNRRLDWQVCDKDDENCQNVNVQVIKSYEGINNWRFKNLKHGNVDKLEQFLESYVKNQLRLYYNIPADKISNFKCAAGLDTVTFTDNDVFMYNEVPDARFKAGDQADILRCYFDYNKGTKNIDFVFKSLRENSVVNIAGANAGLQCLAMDGGTNYDGTHCFGLQENVCKELNTKLRKKNLKGTEWKNDMCVLIAAADAQELQNFKDNMSTAAGIAFTAVTLPVTGATAGATLAVVGLTAAGETLSNVAKQAQSSIVTEVSKIANKCLMGDRNRSCATAALTEIINLNYQIYSIDDNQIDTLDDLNARLLELLQPDERTNYSYYSGKIDVLPILETLGDAMVVVAAFIGVKESAKTLNIKNALSKQGKGKKTIAVLRKLSNAYAKYDDAKSKIEASDRAVKAVARLGNSLPNNPNVAQQTPSHVSGQTVSQNGDGRDKIKNKG